jgi:hypothetical protein
MNQVEKICYLKSWFDEYPLVTNLVLPLSQLTGNRLYGIWQRLDKKQLFLLCLAEKVESL